MRRLQDNIRQIKIELEEDNLYAYKESCDELMSGIMDEIETSIDSGKIKDIENLSREFKSIEQNYSQNFPNIAQKKEIWLS